MSLAAVRTHRHQPAPAPASAAPVARGSRRSPSDLSMRLVRPTVQTKLEVNQPGDRFERQADQVANRVMRQAAPAEEQEELRLAQNPRQVQRAAQPEEEPACIECAQHPRGVQRQGEGGAPSISPRTATTIQNPGPGQPMAPGIRRRIEPHLGADLSHVRVHTDARAAQAAHSLHATAFTYQNHIFTQRPSSSTDLGLMAHEATHVVQQGAVEPRAQRAPDIQRFGVDDLVSGAGAALDAATGAVLDTAGAVVAAGADVLSELVRQVAPEALIQLIDEVGAAGGFAAYLKHMVASTFDGVFDALGTDEETRERLLGAMAMFRDLVGAALEIQIGLLTGDCGPLFAAVSRLGEVVGQVAGEAWDSIAAFFRPIGEFFDQLWQDFGAPVVDWLSKMAGDAWADIQQLGADIWSWTEPVRNAPAGAWDWVKEQLGLGAEGDSEGGLVQWVQGLLAEVWAEVQAELAPVIEPVRAFADRVMEIIPLDAILNLRETVQGWLDRVGQMAQTMATEGQDSSAGVVQNQDTLRDEILPAVLQTIQDLRAGLVSAGEWVSGKIGAVALAVTGFISSLRSSELLGPIAGALDWIEATITNLAGWEQTAVVGLFSLIGDGLVYLSAFVEPVLNVLQQIVSVLGAVIGELPALIFGPVWFIIPDCIRDPIKDFILNYILRAIPIFGQLFESDFWARVQETALRILRQVFVDGDLLGAAWTYFSALLSLLNIPAQLIPEILGKAASVFGDILADPVGFFIHVVGAIKQGFVQFFVNSPAHLFSGALEWLFGQVSEAGITRPPDFSLGSLFGLLLEILGLTKQHVLDLLVAKTDQKTVDTMLTALDTLSSAWQWVTILMDEGLPGIWQEIQSQLSDLATMVIGSVVSWLSEKVMIQATLWLSSFVDPTFLTTAVNILIAIYRAFESAAQYVKDMLEIVSTTLDGIGDIAQGKLDTAANFLEGALADALPVAIGFLMYQLGLGSLGQRLSEIVMGIRERIDSALNWLIDRAIQGGQAILGALGAGGEEKEVDGEEKEADKQGEFDGQIGETVTWTAANLPHRMWIVQEGDDAVVMMESNEKLVGEQLDEYQELAADLEDEDRIHVTLLIKVARTSLSELNTSADDLAIDVAGVEADQQEITQETDTVESKENSLKLLIKRIQELLELPTVSVEEAHEQALEVLTDRNMLLGRGPWIPGFIGHGFETGDTRRDVNALGDKYGCHTTGARDPGTKPDKKGIKNWIPDHQPPNAVLTGGGGPEVRFYPHSLAAAAIQKNDVNAYKWRMIELLHRTSVGWAKGVKSEWFWEKK